MLGIIFTIYMMFTAIKNESISCNMSEAKIISVMSFGTVFIGVIHAIICGDGVKLIYVICFSWLMLLAYVDMLCGYVYDAMEYYGIVIVVPAVIKILGNMTRINFYNMILILCIVLVFYIAARCNQFGMGDADVLAVICVVYADVYLTLLFYAVTIVLFVLRYFKEIIINRGKLSQSKPLLPSIYMAYVLFILFYCI